jgi:excinuclease ABC subunit C
MKSELDDIAGVGAARKKALLRHFGSVEKIKMATVEEIAEVKGVSKKSAAEIVNYFRRNTTVR